MSVTINGKQLPASKMQFGIPDWLLRNLGLPRGTQKVRLSARNTEFLVVTATFIPDAEKKTKEAAK